MVEWPLEASMGIPIEVQGLDTLVREVPSGKVILVESGPDPAKNFFLRRLVLSARKQGKAVTMVTSRDREELQTQLTKESGSTDWDETDVQVQEVDTLRDWQGLVDGQALLLVDSFSLLTLELPPPAMSTLMKDLRSRVRQKELTVVLATDRGMFDDRVEAIAAHLSDGLIEFHARESPEGAVRFLRIPKWADGTFVDRNVYYAFDGSRLAIDLRRRVL